MANAVRTVFQNSDTVLWLTRSLPSVNKLFLVRYIGSLPVMVIEVGEPPRVCRRPFRLSHAAMA